MNGFVEELSLALEVLKRWETLAALAGFIVVWSLFRYVALVRIKRPRLRISIPRRQPKAPAQEAVPHPDEEEESPEERPESSRASR